MPIERGWSKVFPHGCAYIVRVRWLSGPGQLIYELHSQFLLLFPRRSDRPHPGNHFHQNGQIDFDRHRSFIPFIEEKERERERRIGLGDELSSSELAYDVGVRFICYVCAIIAGMIDPSRMSVQLGDVMNRPRQRRRRRRLV